LHCGEVNSFGDWVGGSGCTGGETTIKNEQADEFYIRETPLSYIKQYRSPESIAFISHNQMPTMITTLRI
jgi:hypothetical protein